MMFPVTSLISLLVVAASAELQLQAAEASPFPPCNVSLPYNDTYPFDNCTHPQFPKSDNRLTAWVSAWIDNPDNRQKFGGMKAVVQQLQTNPGLYDTLYGYCAYNFAPNGTIYISNITTWGQCAGTVNDTKVPIPGGADLFAEMKRQKIAFQPVMGLDDPFAAMVNVTPYVESFAAAAKVNGWTGFNLDWEGHNTTGNRSLFLNFCSLMNAFADGLHAHGLEFSTDVQWVTQPYGNKPSTELDALLGAGRATWVTMDTYAYSTGVFLDGLDFYTQRISKDRLAIGISSRAGDSTYGGASDAFVARVHSLRSAGVRELVMFAMPTSPSYMPWIRKFKNDCRGCPSGGVLSCYSNTACF